MKGEFKNKTLLITGGTGSFGTAVLNQFIKTDVKKIIIFSRDEKKQDDMRKHFSSDKLDFILGDVRDMSSILNAMNGVDFVFHAAALKQVPSCEFSPIEAVKTNVVGTENILDAAIHRGVEKVICLSTDKAVYPINAMGISKAMMEKIAIAKSRISGNTKILVTRYGNVLLSRGSVIPLFINQITNNMPLTVTDPNMTRFVMTLEEAVKLVLYAFNNGESGDIFVQKSPATSIGVLANTLIKIFNSKSTILEIGTRHSEKLYEVLCSREEMGRAEEIDNYYRISADVRNLNYEIYTNKGNLSTKLHLIEDYNSHNTDQLNEIDLEKILNSVNIRDALDHGA